VLRTGPSLPRHRMQLATRLLLKQWYLLCMCPGMDGHRMRRSRMLGWLLGPWLVHRGRPLLLYGWVVWREMRRPSVPRGASLFTARSLRGTKSEQHSHAHV